MDYDVEKGLISKLIETKDIRTINDYQIKTSFFTGANKRVFKYIQAHISENGTTPTVRVLESKFPDYELYSYKKANGLRGVGTEEVLTFWCNEVRTKYKHNRLADLVEQAADDLDELETEEAFDKIKRTFAELDSDITISSSVKVNENGAERKQAYLDRVNSGGLLGISTGLHYLDSIIKGLIDECLITIVASTGVGKTWLEVLLGTNCLLQNCSVAHFVTEMSAALMQDRYDALLFSKLHKDGMNYSKFKSGRLSPKQQEEYFYFLDEELPTLEDLWIETATGVMALEQRVKELNPDVIFVDAAYLMEDDQHAKDDWLRVAHITRDLKKMAKRIHKPVIINTQLDENTGKKASPKLGDIKYTQAIGQDCLPADSLVLIENGYKRVQLLQNEVFKVFDGENYKKATCTYAGKKQTAVITYRGEEFRCSPNHKMLVYDNEVESFVWKRAKDIEPHNDYLLEQSFCVKNGHEHVLRVIPNRGKVEINIPIEATYDLGMLIGIFIGDGSLKPFDKGQVSISCGQDTEYADYCLELVHKIFGLKGSIKTICSSSSGNPELVATWYSRALSDWLKFFICDDMGEKTIHVDYIELNGQFRKGLFAGLIQSDGSCIGQLEFTTSIQKNAQRFSLLSKSLGLVTRYDFSKNNGIGKHRVRVSALDNIKDILLVGSKAEQLKVLCSRRVSGRLNKPVSFVKKVCERYLPNIKDTSYSLYKSVNLARKTGKLGQRHFESIFSMPYRFMQVDDVVVTSEEQDMWDIQVFSEDKRIITNGIVNHNSDVVIALYRDEVMINDHEMGLSVLKNREGEGGKIQLSWDFTCMDLSEIYSELPDNEEVGTESVGTLSIDDVD